MQLLLATAIDHFARLGFEGASTRAIARASGTAMSSITYHFGGKEGLYLAAADAIAAAIREQMGEQLAAAQRAVGDSPARTRETMLALVDGFAQMMLRPESANWARFIVREQQAPSEAFERIYEGAMRPMADFAVQCIARLRPDLGEAETRATAVLVMGEALVLRSARASVCRILGVGDIDERAAALLRARLNANISAIFTEPRP